MRWNEEGGLGRESTNNFVGVSGFSKNVSLFFVLLYKFAAVLDEKVLRSLISKTIDWERKVCNMNASSDKGRKGSTTQG